jgi:hypothetical protein
MLDVEALSEMMAGVIAEEVEKAAAPLRAEIAELKARPVGSQMDDIKGVVEVMISDAIVLKSPRNGVDGKDGRDGVDGKDGAGIADLLRDHEGNLVATFTDGRLKNLGPIQGADGKDGRDGFGFDELDACVLDDDRTIELSFKRGEEEKAFTFKWPTVIYRSVFKEGEQYEAGDMVTWGGSLWHCDKATTAKPGTDDWTLACKKGRDGKDARIG